MTSTNKHSHSKSVAQSFKETIESLIVAFILAFVFRAFVVEAFVIPTGSMADTLRGAHFNLTCQKCGYQYNYGFRPELYLQRYKNGNYYVNPQGHHQQFSKGTIPPYPIAVQTDHRGSMRDDIIPTCPVCGDKIDTTQKRWVSNGDRILVLKYIYQFKAPQRWDVIVFKNPTNPQENFIKRLIGCPDETVEIIDGDVYINHKIQQKPKHVQDNLWLVAFDNNYQPLDGAGREWEQPFTPKDNSTKWHTNQPDHSFTFIGSDRFETLSYNTARLKNSCSNYCFYNGPTTYNEAISSDLKLQFTLAPQGQKGSIALSLGKYGRTYTATINFDGSCTLTDQHNNTNLKLTDSTENEAASPVKFPAFKKGHPVKIAFTNLDHRFEIQIGDKKFYHTGSNEPGDWGYSQIGLSTSLPPSVALTAMGQPFSLSNIVIYRDTHYTNNSVHDPVDQGTEGRPMTLKSDQFFAMGDNSPQSHDSRLWNEPGKGNAGKRFRQGIVPREYLIGQAFFVYWPGGFRPHQAVPYAVVPDVGNMRFIH
ncbi:MAG: signal peptidase I [Phycisphaerae bacterium]|nr:signal peptidase I [Phycisphaerae bacterium]